VAAFVCRSDTSDAGSVSRQADEMANALNGTTVAGQRAFTDSQINNLAQRHFEQLEVGDALVRGV